ncbi:MAG: Fe-S cluster assembly ATPase SufC, partial [Acidimicrobiales bacterium]
FQRPQVIPGVSVIQFLHQALAARKGIDLSVAELRLVTVGWMRRLGVDSSFIDRQLNEGFSADEKQRHEMLQMAILEPEIAILDETESGIDIDIDIKAIAAQGIREARVDNPNMGLILITNDLRLVDAVTSDDIHIHILIDGRIVASGGRDLAAQLEKNSDNALRTLSIGV